MKIDILRDIGVPVGVGLTDTLVSEWDTKRCEGDNNCFELEPLVGLAGSATGMIMMTTGWAANIGQPMMHASLSMATKAVYDYVKDAFTELPAGASRTRVTAYGTRDTIRPMNTVNVRSGSRARMAAPVSRRAALVPRTQAAETVSPGYSREDETVSLIVP